MKPTTGAVYKDGSNESGTGLPHSKTSRTERRAIRRASVLECGSPMPL